MTATEFRRYFERMKNRAWQQAIARPTSRYRLAGIMAERLGRYARHVQIVGPHRLRVDVDEHETFEVEGLTPRGFWQGASSLCRELRKMSR